MKISKQTIIFLIILITVSTIVKIICAPQINLSGFSCVFAVCMFAGLTIKNKKLAFLIPLAVLFISDIILQVLHAFNFFPYAGFYSGQVLNYILFLLITLVAVGLKNFKTTGIIASIFIGPTLFFLLSNFMVWKTGASIMGYNTGISGLWQSYTFGLPFYRNSLISTFIFLPAFIALYNWMAYGRFRLALQA